MSYRYEKPDPWWVNAIGLIAFLAVLVAFLFFARWNWEREQRARARIWAEEMQKSGLQQPPQEQR